MNTLFCLNLLQEPISLPDQLDEATKYIKKLQMNLEKLKDRKNILLEIQRPNVSMNKGKITVGSKSPQIEIQQMGLALAVVLTTGLDCGFLFNKTIRVLHEEGADIVSASYMVVEDAIFHTIHCQVSYKFYPSNWSFLYICIYVTLVAFLR